MLCNRLKIRISTDVSSTVHHVELACFYSDSEQTNQTLAPVSAFNGFSCLDQECWGGCINPPHRSFLICFLHTCVHHVWPTEVAVRFGTVETTWALSLNLPNR